MGTCLSKMGGHHPGPRPEVIFVRTLSLALLFVLQLRTRVVLWFSWHRGTKDET